ncbi:hypothetical protein QQ045_009731 [Rhodiola kirilowii]
MNGIWLARNATVFREEETTVIRLVRDTLPQFRLGEFWSQVLVQGAGSRPLLEQFNDVLIQENCLNPTTAESHLVSPDDLDYITKNKTIFVERLKLHHPFLFNNSMCTLQRGWCSNSDVESFKVGQYPVCPPAKEYTNVLVRGLVEGEQLSDEEATALIQDAASRPL